MTHRIWVGGRYCWLLASGDSWPDGKRLTFHDAESAREWLQQLSSTTEGGHLVRNWLYSAWLAPSAADFVERDLLDYAAGRLMAGELVVVMEKERIRSRFSAPSAAKSKSILAEEPVPYSRPNDEPEFEVTPKRPAHWIEIELVGDDDKPIPNEAYIVVFPDGKETRGRLNKAGFARISSIAQPGTCKVSFPNLDTDAWERI